MINRMLSLTGLLLLVLITGSSAVMATPLSQASSTIPDLDIVLLIDESGSAWFRTDPESTDYQLRDDGRPATTQRPSVPPYRIRAAQLFVNMLAVETDRDHTLSIYMFGESTVPVVENIELRGRSSQINQMIVDKHYELGASLFWTDIDEAVQKAQAQLSNRPVDPERRSVVVLITDGKPETEAANLIPPTGESAPTAEQSEIFARYLEQLKASIAQLDRVPNGVFTCPSASSPSRPLYVLGVDQEALTALAGTRYVGAEYDNFWVQPNVVGSQYRPVTDFPNLNAAVTKIVSEILCASAITLPAALPLPQTYRFEVKPNFTEIKFIITTSDPNIQTTIRAADDSQVTPTTSGVEFADSSTSQVWRIVRTDFASSWDGTWTVDVTGQGEVSFAPIGIGSAYNIRLLQPAKDLHPAGKNLDLIGEVVDDTNTPYTDTVEDFSISYTVAGSDGSASQEPPLSAAPDATAPYRYQARLDQPRPGTYTFQMAADLRGDEFAQLAPAKTLQITPGPFANIVAPRPGADLTAGEILDIEVLAKIMTSRDDQPRPVDLGTANKAKVTATLLPVGETTPVTDAVLDASGKQTYTHSGQLQLPDEAGEYELEVTIEYETQGGLLVDKERITISLAPVGEPLPPDPVETAIPPPIVAPPREDSGGAGIIAGTLGALLAAASAGGAYWYLFVRGPNLKGVTISGSDGAFKSLSGRSHTMKIPAPDGSTAQVKLYRNSDYEIQAKVIKSETPLRIGKQPVAAGDVVPITSSTRIEVDGGEGYYDVNISS